MSSKESHVAVLEEYPSWLRELPSALRDTGHPSGDP